MTNRHVAILIVASSLALGALVRAQQPPPPASPPPAPAPAAPRSGGAAQTTAEPGSQPPVTFRVEVNYVEVDALVTDKQGQVVRGLTRDDFQVYEDGKLQNVNIFSFVDLPIERAEKPVGESKPIEPDVVTNERPFQGRVFVLALDDLHTAAQRSLRVRAAARRFIQQYMGDNDIVAVVQLSGRTDASQEFTSNKRLILAAVDKFMGQKLRSATLNRLDEYNRNASVGAPNTGRINDPEDMERGYKARMTLETLKQIADVMTGIRGRRKALVFLSEGIDYDIYDPFNNRDASTVLDSTRDAISAATRANVSIYGIDPRGLTNLGDDMIEVSGGFPDDPSLGINQTAMRDELQRSQDSLRVLSEQTGGFAAVNSNDFAGAFERLIRDNSSYYVLGYYPANDKRDGRQHRIEVKVSRPGLEVRSRKTYVSPKGKAEAAKDASAGASFKDMMNSPLQESGLPMGVQAAAFKGTAPNASVLVTVQVAGRQFDFKEQGGQFVDKLDVTLVAIGPDGKTRTEPVRSVELKLKPETRQAIQAAGIRVMSRVDLPPGRYQLRVMGLTGNSGNAGSVHYDVDVPDFSKEAFSMSGLVLTSAAAAMTPTAQGDEQIKAVLPGPPTVARTFSTADTLALFVEVYDNEVNKPHKVDISTTVRSTEDPRVLFKTEEERSTEELKGARGGYGYTAQVPLKELAPGTYVLRVGAQSRLSGNAQPMMREVEFTVVAPPQPRPSPPAAGATPGPGGPASGTAPGSAPSTAPPGRSIVTVARGAQSTVSERREVIARTPEEFAALWATLGLPRAAPNVNFTNTMIAAVFLGSRATAGYGVLIVEVVRDGETLVIRYAEQRPQEGSSNAQVVTAPYAVAGVPMWTGDVRFEKVEGPAR